MTNDHQLLDAACSALTGAGRPTSWALAGPRNGPTFLVINGRQFDGPCDALAYLTARLRDLCAVKEYAGPGCPGGPSYQDHGYHGCANIRKYEQGGML